MQFRPADAGTITLSGIAFFTKKIYSEHASLTAVDTNDGRITAGLTFQVLPGAAVDFSCPQPTSKVTGYHQLNGPVGVNDDLGLPFTALDQYGNNATNKEPLILFGSPLPIGYQGPATVTTSDPKAVNITDATFDVSSFLIRNPATITFRTAGVQTITITDPNDPSLKKTCSYQVFGPKAVTGTISVPDPRTTGNTTIPLAASTGVAGNDPVTIDLLSVPTVNGSPVGLVEAPSEGPLPFLAWNLDPVPTPAGTIVCTTSAPCAPSSGLLQIAYTIHDAFGSPASSGLLTIEPWTAVTPPGSIDYTGGGNILVPGVVDPDDTSKPATLPLNQALNGTVQSTAAGTGTIQVYYTTTSSINVSIPPNSSLTSGAPVTVVLQQPITVASSLENVCFTNEQGLNVCTGQCASTASGSAPVTVCEHSSFATVTIVPANPDPNNPPPSQNVETGVVTDVCGAVSNTNNAACPYVSFNFAARGSPPSPGTPPIGVVGAPYEYQFDGFSSSGESITYSLTPDPLTNKPSTLPAGMSLTSTGELTTRTQDSLPGKLTGTPGIFNFIVTAKGVTTGKTATVTVLLEIL